MTDRNYDDYHRPAPPNHQPAKKVVRRSAKKALNRNFVHIVTPPGILNGSWDPESAEACQEQLDNGDVVFQYDHRSNPVLHLLYVSDALVHLRTIDESILKFGEFCNTNMTPIVGSLLKCRTDLVHQNAAYCQANVFLLSVGLKAGSKIVNEE